MTSAADQVFGIPELLELILTYIPEPAATAVAEADDPRSAAIVQRARRLATLLHASGVSKAWAFTIDASPALQRLLYRHPDWMLGSWGAVVQAQDPDPAPHSDHARGPLGNLERDHASQHRTRPALNPLIQHCFPAAHFRFSHLPAKDLAGRYQAYLVLERDEARTWAAAATQRSWASMQLSQPPCVEVAAIVWDRRESLAMAALPSAAFYAVKRIKVEEGLTMGVLLAKVAEMFEVDETLNAIKICTV